MRLKTKILLTAIPIASAVVVTAVTVAVIKHRRKKRHRHGVMSEEVRTSMEELLRLKGEDFIPDGLGTSIYQRKLKTLNDRQLLGLYTVIKMVDVLHDRGIEISDLSREDLENEITKVRDSMGNRQGRKEIVSFLGTFGSDTIHSMMSDGIVLAEVAALA